MFDSPNMSKVLTAFLLSFSLLSAHAQLSGTYTIDPNGSGSNNFVSFSAAAMALSTNGVSSAVVFQVKQGSYNEQVVLSGISGASSSNTVRFEPQPADTLRVFLEYLGNGANNYVVRISDAGWITFQGLNFTSLDTIFGRVFDLPSSAEHISIEGCSLTSGSIADTSTLGALVFAPGFTNNLQIERCSFNGGSIGVYVTGTNPQYADSIILRNNDFSHQYFRGIDLQSVEKPLIANNRIGNEIDLADNASGIWIKDGRWLSILSNYIGADHNQGYGIHITACDGSAGNRQTIANNCVTVGDTGQISSAIHALYMNTCSNIDLFYNTLTRIEGPLNQAATYIENSSSVSLLNNNISCYPGIPLYVTSSSLATSDHNNLYTSSGSVLYYLGSNYYELTDWQNAGSFDQNSVSIDPTFSDTLTCRNCNNNLNNEGISIAGLDKDIQGTDRSNPRPSIGAVEVLNAAAFSIGPDTTICADSFLIALDTAHIQREVQMKSLLVPRIVFLFPRFTQTSFGSSKSKKSQVYPLGSLSAERGGLILDPGWGKLQPK